MPVKAKVPKNRRAHLRAIEKFSRWLADNPDATHQQIFNAFDVFVDREVRRGS